MKPDRIRDRAVELIACDGVRKRGFVFALGTGAIGFAVGLLIDGDLAPVALVAAAIGGLAFAATR